MANVVHNRSKGRVTQFAELILGAASPYTNAAFIVIGWNTSAADSVLIDLDDVAAIEANASTAELTNSGYARKVIDETGDGLVVTYDDTADTVYVDFSDQTWTAVAAGTNFTDVGVEFDNDTTAGTDSNILPCTWHDFAVTTDGSDVTAVLAANGFYSAA